MNQVEAGERDDKHDPAGELVEEAESLFRIPILYAETGTDDAGDVGGDSDGNAGQSKNDAAFRSLLEKVAVKDSQGEQAHQRADSATGLGDLQFHDRQFDDVTLVQCRDAQEGQYVTGDS